MTKGFLAVGSPSDSCRLVRQVTTIRGPGSRPRAIKDPCPASRQGSADSFVSSLLASPIFAVPPGEPAGAAGRTQIKASTVLSRPTLRHSDFVIRHFGAGSTLPSAIDA